MPRSEAHNAYEAATRRLRDEEAARFDELLDEERADRGLKSLVSRRHERIAEMEKRLARLRQRVGE